MKIHRIRLAHYRGIDHSEVAFADTGVTVVEGPNEIGKSSLAEALDLLLEHYDDSKKAAVRATKPVHHDVGTEIEVELSAGPYRLNYAKRFHKDRYTTLTVHAPAPEQLTGREAHERVRTILQDTVDLDLYKALRISQGQAVGQPDLRSTVALAAALDLAAGEHQGGEREQSILDRVQKEFERYFTPTGQDNAWFKGVRATYQDADARMRALRAELDALERDVERSAEISAEIDALEPQAALEKERLAELTQRWEQVRQRANNVERLVALAERAQSDARLAQQARETRRALVEQLATAEATAEELVAQRDETAPLLRDADDAAKAAADAVTALRAQLSETRVAYRAAQEAEERSRDALSYELLSERWQRVQDARSQAAAAREVLDHSKISQAALDTIEAAFHVLAQAQAGMQLDAPLLKLSAIAAVTVEIDGAPLELVAGQAHEQPVTEAVRLRFGELEASVLPGHSADALRDRVAAAQQAYDEACAACAVNDYNHARTALKAHEDAERALQDSHRIQQENLRDLSPDELESRVLRLQERLAEAAPSNPEYATAQREQLELTVTEVESALEAADNNRQDAEQQRAAVRERHTALALRAEQALNDVAALRTALDAARAETDDTQLDVLCAQADDAAATAIQAAAAAQAELQQDDPDSVATEYDNARAKVEKHAQELRERQDARLQLNSRLLALGEAGLQDRLASAEAQLEQASAAWQQAQRGAAAAKLLFETLLAHRDESRRAYRAPLREKIEVLGRIVFGADFSVELDDELNITQRTLAGRTLATAQLSTGTQEQLAVLSRLAVAAITGQDGGVPVILDDALGWSDPARLASMGAAFSVAARNSQVIVLTCMPDRYRHIGTATTVRL